MSSIIFTYYSETVAHSFLTNVESWLTHGEKYDSLIICSDLEIPKKIVNRLIEKIRVQRVLPSQITKDIRKRSNRVSALWNINPAVLSAFNYSAADTITVIDPNLFIIKAVEFEKTDSVFFKSHIHFISANLFKFKYSKSLEQMANQILSKMDFQSSSSDLIFSQFVTQCTSFGTKSFSTSSFIFSKPETDHKFIESKVFAIDFSNITEVSRFKELTGVKDSLISSKKTNFLSRIRKVLHEFTDTVNITPDSLLTPVPFLQSNYEKYRGTNVKNFTITLVYTKQVANHANTLEKTLVDLGFSVTALLKSPGSALNPNDPTLHIVMCPNVFYNFPKHYIAYQFEQAHSRWFTKDYIHRLNSAIEIWDYSEYNINYFKGQFGRPHIFVPVGRVEHNIDIFNQARDIDVLFYGEHAGSSRRTNFLNDMKELRPITVVDGFSVHKFGSDIVDILKRTKVVLNHHYYDNGNLEVVRVCEALSYGCKVVSEVSVDDTFQDLPILRYSSVNEADILLKSALSDKYVHEFNKSNKGFIKSAISRLGFNIHNRIAVFAHYDALNQIDDYVVDYLTKLRKFCDTIIFVSDCNVPPSELEKISHLISDSICGRHGESNDLGSYKRGFNLILEKYKSEISKIDQFLFVNDSGYCVGDLTPAFATMTAADVDAWALCDHAPDPKLIKDKCYLQSNFFAVNRDIFTSTQFSSFMNSITVSYNKSEIVDKYELGLSEMLIKNNYRTGSYIRTANLAEYIRSNDTQLTDEVLSILSGNYSNITSDIMSRIFKPNIGGDYVYSDHFYTLLKIGFPLIKCLAVVPNQEATPDNKLINYWKPLLISKLGSAQVNQMLTHIFRIGKTPKSPNTIK